MKIKDKLLLLILFLALIPAIAIALVFYFTAVEALRNQMEKTYYALEDQIEKTHYDKVISVDTLIFVVVSDMVNIAFTAGPKIADSIEEQDYQSLKEKLKLIDQMDDPKIGTGRGIGYHIVIATDKQGNVLARSDIAMIDGKKVKTGVAQTGHIIGDWIPSENFKIGFEKAKQGQIDARKVIYDQEFIKREGYGHLIEKYGFKEVMGLTAQMPILNPEEKQVGILFIITILNNNHAAIGAINAITGAEFTAITPRGEIMASFFINPPIPSSEIIEKARQRTMEMAQNTKEPRGKDTVIYTKERVYLKSCPGKVIFKNGEGACYHNGEIIPYRELKERPYRFHFIAEVDLNFHYVAIRGIAYDLVHFDELIAVQIAYFDESMTAQTRHFIITFLIAFILIGGLSLVIAGKGASSILEFTKKIQQIEKGDLKQRIELKTGDEIETLAKAFNNMLEKINESYEKIEEQKDVLGVKVNARTKELKEFSKNLEERVEERTKELQERLEELERFHKITVGRETKMVELKKEIMELKERLKN